MKEKHELTEDERKQLRFKKRSCGSLQGPTFRPPHSGLDCSCLFKWGRWPFAGGRHS